MPTTDNTIEQPTAISTGWKNPRSKNDRCF